MGFEGWGLNYTSLPPCVGFPFSTFIHEVEMKTLDNTLANLY